jgi:hypothetical protein
VFLGRGKVLVADGGHNRVLVWNTLPTTSGAPTGVWTDGTRLVVADNGNNRVLIWNQFPTANGTAADLVLGQQDFTTATPFDPPTGDAPSARSLSQPAGILLAWPHVGVPDYGNNRLLVFESR